MTVVAIHTLTTNVPGAGSSFSICVGRSLPLAFEAEERKREKAMSALPPEKIAELRQLVHSHVTKAGVQEQIRGCIAGVVSEGDTRYSMQSV